LIEDLRLSDAMTEQNSLIKKFQERVAMISIGPSTLRGQGACGIVKAARKYLADLNLAEFKNAQRTDSRNC